MVNPLLTPEQFLAPPIFPWNVHKWHPEDFEGNMKKAMALKAAALDDAARHGTLLV
jgi:hypothetical protein